MAGEINGTTVIIANGAGTIVGQGEFTLTQNGTPIDISNKSYGDDVTLLDAELSGKQVQYSGTIVYNNDAQYEKVRADAFTGTQDDYTITYASTGETYAAKFVPNGLSDAVPYGDKVQTTINFLSSGPVTRTPPTP